MNPRPAAERIASIDLVRGAVMILMVVDHAREYSSGPGRVGDPMQLDQVTPLLYLLRWVSHFCAPVFALLMGVSAGLQNAPAKQLLLRGAVLIALEFTIIDWSWTFNPLWPRKFWQVIAALGASSILLGALVPLGRRAVVVCGLAIVGLHNLFDGVAFAPGTAAHYVWSFLHQKNILALGGGFEVRTTYPFLPLAGVVMLGYALAPWFRDLPAAGRRKLALTGAGACLLFLLLRTVVGYGDPHPLESGGGIARTLQSLGNVTKYPVSLQFVLMTVGPALLALAALAKARGPAWLAALGQAPMFFYIGHLYALHAIALVWAAAQGLPMPGLTARFGGIPEPFGFPLWVTIPFALGTTALLLPACRWYGRLRASRRFAALRYI